MLDPATPSGNRLLRSAVCVCLSLSLASPTVLTAGIPGDVELSGFVLKQESGDGVLQIRAREARYDDENTVFLVQVTAQLTEGDRIRMSLNADTGRYQGRERLLQLEGAVSAQTNEGYRFSTSSLEWDGPDGLVRSRGDVLVTREGLLVRGRGLEHSVRSGRTVLGGGVRATLTLGGPNR